MKGRIKYIIIIAMYLICNYSNGHDFIKLRQYEDTLKTLAKIVSSGESNKDKIYANKKLIATLGRAIEEKNSFNYPFDSLISIARLVSPDKSFRIFNWVLLTDEGGYKYFGLVQICDIKTNTCKIISLEDKSDSLSNPANLILSSENWFGALYYKIIYTKYNKMKYYTLLGWQGNNLLSRKKIIDVITFSPEDDIVFGADIFISKKEQPKRIIFEYSAEAVMSLKYEQQYYNKLIFKNQKLKTKNRKKVKKKKAFMIVFDRLVPLSPGLEGVYQYYVPAMDYVDAYIFRSGKWRMVMDIEAYNPLRRKPYNTTTPDDFQKR